MGKSVIAELQEEFAVASQIAAIEDSDIEFGIVFLEFSAFPQKSLRWTDTEAQIP
jgi:hypothetical protein